MEPGGGLPRSQDKASKPLALNMKAPKKSPFQVRDRRPGGWKVGEGPRSTASSRCSALPLPLAASQGGGGGQEEGVPLVSLQQAQRCTS